MIYMSAKFTEETHNSLVSIMFTIILIHVNCDLDLWPLTFKINRVHPLNIVNMSAKFDEEAHNGLVSIMFTRSKRDRDTNWRTEPQQRSFLLGNALLGDN